MQARPARRLAATDFFVEAKVHIFCPLLFCSSLCMILRRESRFSRASIFCGIVFAAAVALRTTPFYGVSVRTSRGMRGASTRDQAPGAQRSGAQFLASEVMVLASEVRGAIMVFSPGDTQPHRSAP